MGTKIFLPLRSNTSWFSEEEAVARFERLLKVHIALYDDLVLEDGTFQLIAGENLQGMSSLIPPNSSNCDRTQLRFFEPGGDFGVSFDNKFVLQDKMSFGCNADFVPILSRAGLLEATYFEWKSCDLHPDIKRQTDQIADREYRDSRAMSVLPQQSYVRKELLRGFYRDAVLAQALRLPMAVDHHLAGYLDLKRKENARHTLPSIALVFLDHWVNLELPDFGNYTWEEIHVLHESEIGNDFRRMVERITSRVESAISDQPEQADLRDLVEHEFSVELVNELRLRRTTLGVTGLNLLLNFVPYGSVISAMKDTVEFGRDSTSWISLL